MGRRAIFFVASLLAFSSVFAAKESAQIVRLFCPSNARAEVRFSCDVLEAALAPKGIAVLRQDDPKADIFPCVLDGPELDAGYIRLHQPFGRARIGLYGTPALARVLHETKREKWPRLIVATGRSSLSSIAFFKEWSKAWSTQISLTNLSTYADSRRAVLDRTADLMLFAGMVPPEDLTEVAALSERPWFAAVRRNRQDLAGVLSDAVEQFRVYHPDVWDRLARTRLNLVAPTNRVRVGLYLENGYCEEGPGGVWTGASIEILHRLSEINDWTPDYIYCSVSNALKYLSESVIDIVPEIDYTPERARHFLFPNLSTGIYRSYLFTLSDSPYTAENPKNWNGIKIAVPRGYGTENVLRKRLYELGVSCEYVPYETGDDCTRALFRGACQAVLAGPASVLNDQKLLLSLPGLATYTAVAMKRPDLRDRVNAALTRLADESPFYLFGVFRRYRLLDRLEAVNFTPKELSWLTSRQRDLGLRVDLSPAYPPLKYVHPETEQAEGFANILFSELSRRSGLLFNCVSCVGIAVARSRMLNGETDIWLDFQQGDEEIPGSCGVIPVVRIPQVMTCLRRNFDQSTTTGRLAVDRRETDRLAMYARFGLEPQIVLCESTEDCFRALFDGRADRTVSNPFDAQRYLSLSGRRGDAIIRTLQHPVYMPRLSLCVSRRAGPVCLSVLRKMISSIGEEDLQNQLFRVWMNETKKPLLTNVQIIGLVLALILVFGVVLIGFGINANIRIRNALDKTHIALLQARDAKARMQDALDQANVAVKIKTGFLATMSHEIRTPLNAVIGFCELLSNQGISFQQIKEYTDGITCSSHALLALINDILDLSKLEAGSVDMTQGVCDFPKLMTEMRAIFKYRLSTKGLLFETHLSSGLPLVCLTEQRMRQVILNLIGNAVKFTDSGRIDCSVEGTDNEDGTLSLRICVADTGIGIPPNEQKQIFDPFVQDSITRGGQVYAGTGLGLPIVNRLITACGGTVRVESELGKGTRFILDIKRVARAAVSAEPSETVDATAGFVPPPNFTVLLVDDVPMNLRILSLHMRALGVKQVVALDSGKKALRFLETTRVDAVLTDMWMPGMNGVEFATAARAFERMKEVPIIAVTADNDAAATFDMTLFTAAVTKPVTLVKLRTVMTNVLTKKKS